jgi:hypothetical protein
MKTRSIVRGALVAAALIVSAPAAMAVGPAGASAAPEAAPDPADCPQVHVDSAEVVKTIHGPAIQVKGLMPQSNMTLHLIPEDIVYVQQPDYWNYFVVGCSDGIGLPVKTPFTKLFRVPTYPVGKLGITVNGIIVDLFDGPPVS